MFCLEKTKNHVAIFIHYLIKNKLYIDSRQVKIVTGQNEIFWNGNTRLEKNTKISSIIRLKTLIYLNHLLDQSLCMTFEIST